MMRGSYVLVIVPYATALRLPLGARKFTRLSKLKNSPRNSKLPLRHGMEKRFDATRSMVHSSGPRTLLRGALPKGWLGSVGSVTVVRLSQLLIVRSPSGTSGSPLTFGR